MMLFRTSSSVTQQVHLFWPGPSLWWVFIVSKCVCSMSLSKQHLSIINKRSYNLWKRDMYLLALIIFLQSTQNEKLWSYAQYMYDALGQRIRLKEQGTYENKTFTFDALLLFREVSKDTNIPNIYFRVQLLLIRRVEYRGNNCIKSISTEICFKRTPPGLYSKFILFLLISNIWTKTEEYYFKLWLGKCYCLQHWLLSQEKRHLRNTAHTVRCIQT